MCLFPLFFYKKTSGSFVLVLALVLTFSSCTDPNAWKKVDVSKIDAPLTVCRFEQDFFAIDTGNFPVAEKALRQKYGLFYDDYVLGIMAFAQPPIRGDTTKVDPHQSIRLFLSNSSDRQLYDSVQKQYSDIRDITTQLQDALRHFRYYFPEKDAPSTLYTFISEFANGAITYGDTIIGIGLDMYLGKRFVFYDGVGFPEFMRRKLTRMFIVPNAMEALYNNYYDQSTHSAELPLIEAMINEGKKYYFLECMMPALHDSVLIGYTCAQEEWARKSQKQIWRFFNDNDLLYKVNFMEQKRYITDGPTTPGMPPEAPGRIGSWLGWQIVRKYMRHAEGTISLREMIEQKSAKEIFAKANYKPI